MAPLYFPPKHGQPWETVEPAAAGFDPARLQAAVQFALDHEDVDTLPHESDMDAFREWQSGAKNASEPPGVRDIVGPTRPRGHTNGVILKGGRIVAEFGDTERVDMTFSATKSYMSTTVGLAWGDGLIPDLDAPVGELVKDGGFDSEHNAKSTWRHFLHQSSEWSGSLFTKPDSVDHNRVVGAGSGTGQAQHSGPREMREPGTFYEYNDVRVNRLGLSALRVHGTALPSVLRSRIMDPIGASDTWEWHGYSTSMVELDGEQVESVSGGGHWGGGMHICSRDHARFGLLHLAQGSWDGRKLLPSGWIEIATEPSATNHQYGAMWWLNTDGEKGRMYPAAPATSYSAQGAGGNHIWVEPSLDLVVVVRWCGDFKGLTAKIMGALADPARLRICASCAELLLM